MSMRIIKPQPIAEKNAGLDYWGLAAIYDDSEVPDDVAAQAMQRHSTSLVKCRKGALHWQELATNVFEHEIRKVSDQIYHACGFRATIRPVLVD